MGYALKLKNVNFSSVAVDRVTFVESVPCTGISLNKNALNFQTCEETDTLVATLTPSDTTDVLMWSSSNDNIATVENGVVTIHGIGTAIITAACGNQTVSITVNQTQLKAPYDLKIVTGRYPTSNGTGGPIYLSASATESSVGQAYRGNADLRVRSGNTYDMELVRVPYGATKVYIKTSDDARATISYMYRANTDETVIDGDIAYPAYISRKDFFYSDVGADVEYGQAIIFRPGNERDLSTLSYIYFV